MQLILFGWNSSEVIVMDSYERFYKASFGWNRKVLKMFGFDMYDKDYSPNIVTYFTYALFFGFTSIMIYSYVIADNFNRLNCLFLISFLFQVSVPTKINSNHRF